MFMCLCGELVDTLYIYTHGHVMILGPVAANDLGVYCKLSAAAAVNLYEST